MLPPNVRSYGRDCCRFGAATNVEHAGHVATVGEGRKLLVILARRGQRDEQSTMKSVRERTIGRKRRLLWPRGGLEPKRREFHQNAQGEQRWSKRPYLRPLWSRLHLLQCRLRTTKT